MEDAKKQLEALEADLITKQRLLKQKKAEAIALLGAIPTYVHSEHLLKLDSELADLQRILNEARKDIENFSKMSTLK